MKHYPPNQYYIGEPCLKCLAMFLLVLPIDFLKLDNKFSVVHSIYK